MVLYNELMEKEWVFPKQWRGGRGYKKYSFTLVDIAKVKGKSVDAVRMEVFRKKIDLNDLRTFMNYVGG